ncbi:MAG: hypothetical protein ACOYXT_09360 [Bacteroidota bacterium]
MKGNNDFDLKCLLALINIVFLLGCTTSQEEPDSGQNNSFQKETVTSADTTSQIVESIDSISGNRYLKEYYLNGILKHEWEETQMNGGLAVSYEQFYDSIGHLTQKKEYRYSDGTTYDETHVVMKSTDYYSGGGIKVRRSEEYFMMGEKCPCGIWEYFDESGKLIKQEKKGNCEDFDLNCL